MEKRTVNIHGKEYETVASRVQKFRAGYKEALSLTTKIEWQDDERVVMQAAIATPEGFVIATGHAEERRDSSTINRTSALENCETSAIGRCLAAFGLAGTEYASADEVAQAISNQGQYQERIKSAPKITNSLATEKQVKLMLAKSREFSGLQEREDILNWFEEVVGQAPNTVKLGEVDTVLGVLQEAAQ